MVSFFDYMLVLTKYALIIFSFVVVERSLRSMFNEKYENETWAYVRFGRERYPVNHWENILGISASSDIRIYAPGISRVHAVLCRNDKGQWKVYDVFSRGGVWVNQQQAGYGGAAVKDGDVINLAGNRVTFQELESEKITKLEKKRSAAGSRVVPAITLLWLSLFQSALLGQHLMSCPAEHRGKITLAFVSVMVLEWFCFTALRVINKSGFEIETLAFFLTTLGVSVAATSTPEDMYKQAVLVFASVFLFLLLGWWLRNLKRTASARIPFALLALGLLGLNMFAGISVFGAKNWLTIAGYSFQPSEFVKVFYVYVGASTLDRLYMKRNLYVFVGFSAVCVLALALMGDFGSALVFFICFLVISFMRSGSIATVILAVSGAVMAGLMAVSARPYVAQRFSTWGHAWEDVYDTGYQQVRAMSAAAAGGLFGKGAGNGWLQSIVAANTDMVFGIVSEELGLLIALSAILAIIALAVFAIRSAIHCRSSFYSIAACASVTIMLVQVALNVFGSMDILPFTGVTFPFVSRGGSSLISCWMLLAFIKSADNRREASFAVRAAERYKRAEELLPPEVRKSTAAERSRA